MLDSLRLIVGELSLENLRRNETLVPSLCAFLSLLP